jgi:hypothetical protein
VNVKLTHRVVTYNLTFEILWVFLAFFFLFPSNILNHIPLSLASTIILAGAASGIIINYKMTKRKIRIVEKKGVWSTPASTWLFFIGIIVIIVAFLAFIEWSAISLLSQYLMFFTDFSYTLIPTALITEALIFRRWETKERFTPHQTKFTLTHI